MAKLKIRPKSDSIACVLQPLFHIAPSTFIPMSYKF